MTSEAHTLHDEVVKSLNDKKVDPFERCHRPERDDLVHQAVRMESRFINDPVKLSTWRDFSSNLKIVERKTKKNATARSSTEKHLSTRNSGTNCGKKSFRYQDSYQPSRTRTCTFLPEPTGRKTFDNNVIGPINSIPSIMEDLESSDATDSLMLRSGLLGTDSPSRCSESIALSPVKQRGSSRAESGSALSNDIRGAFTSPIKRKQYAVRPGDIGSRLPGGVMTLGPSRERHKVSITQNCDSPTVWELDGGSNSSMRTLKGGVFSVASRFPDQNKARGDSSYTSKATDHSGNFKGRFSNGDRFNEPLIQSCQAGPGSYNVQRLFDNTSPRLSNDRVQQIIRLAETDTGIMKEGCKGIAEAGIFCYGCSFEEHAKYGMCLDGMCGRRSKWEEVMLIKNDKRRLAGAVNKDGSKFSSSQVNVGVEGVAGVGDFTPLKTAAMNGDLDTVVKLCMLGSDINEADKQHKRRALHYIVIRNFLPLLRALTGGCGGWVESESNPNATIYKRLFQSKIDLNPQDDEGNTPLHLAAMNGNSDLVEVLCDAGAEPLRILNDKNQSPADAAHGMHIFQIIKMCATLRDTEREYTKIQKQRRQSQANVQRLIFDSRMGKIPKMKSSASSRALTKHTSSSANENSQLGYCGNNDANKEPPPSHAEVCDSWDKRKDVECSQHSFHVGYIAPSDIVCKYDHMN
mmetsp:Transcript_9933/g.14970  ORF Transcript_9933/g.14970 Transcript_9933/m.14970 type:complete len:688 (-) Transcript_9933:204-2267(-)|eukprot:CAMPEP_0185030542 /NCGR_PEP_ID=MMETSP1103-20130426/17531_1 /TAXON_ID=36769 /ORGANISM="Paraphysomonas bandaiensis, Strain Caron Lab Isolate" /LENGTH=687 /DNA_ID=CAMNT_0027565723 /DNA_START=56 /DNA_END=2119 /DNA_ORIENTATION=+